MDGTLESCWILREHVLPSINDAIDVSRLASSCPLLAASCSRSLACEVWVAGSNSVGQLGPIDAASPRRSGFAKSSLLSSVIVSKIACGDHGTVLELGTGEVVSLGRIGHPDEPSTRVASQPRFIPVQMPANASVREIACGSGHAVVSLLGGGLVAWGCNDCGQLGVGDQTHRGSPTRVLQLQDCEVVRVCCGSHHTLAYTDRRLLYVWGMNDQLQLGLAGTGQAGERKEPTLNTMFLELDVTLKQLYCCRCSNVALAETGVAYCWGFGGWGEIGNGRTGDSRFPCEVEDLKGRPIKRVVGSPTMLAVAAELENGDLYVWGRNATGALGAGMQQYCHPTQLCLGGRARFFAFGDDFTIAGLVPEQPR
eukprot:m51a1_g3335 hypothetical protein (367) ;mRNA; r:382941-384459